jgi:hypothetical protein
MPRRKVVELLSSWRGQLGSRSILEARRLAPLCLMRYAFGDSEKRGVPKTARNR